MTIYLGPVGNLIALPSIGRGISAPLTVPSAVHQLAGRGGRVVDRFPSAAARTYQLSRAWLTQDEISVLEALYMGAYGPGPFCLVEPWRRNLLSANQSSGTDVLADTTGFTTGGFGGTLTTTTVASAHGSRSLALAVTATVQRAVTGALSINPTNRANPLTDIPVLPSTSYTASVVGKLSTSTGSVIIELRWYTAAGVAISTAASSNVALNTSTFTAATVTATSPSTAAICRIDVVSSVMGAAQTIYLDKWQLEQASSAGAWTLGTGVPRVSFTDELSQTYVMWPSADASFTLVEVGTS